MTVRQSRSIRLALAFAATLLVAASARTSLATTIAGGNVINQTWTPAGSPYVIQGDITVPSGATLTIQAGTAVRLASTDGQTSGVDANRVEITINGTLNVTGTAANPVTFQAQSGTSANIWYGIIAGASAAAVNITGATIQHAYYGITSNAPGTVLSVSGTNILTTTYGVYISAGSPKMDALTVSGSTYGFYLVGSGGLTLTNTVIRGNLNYGMYVVPSSGAPTVSVTNCTFDANGWYGIYATGAGGTPTVNLVNSIVTNHTVYGLYRALGSLTFAYSDVWGNSTNTFGTSAGSGNISQNPNYKGPPTDLSLVFGSGAIDAGTGTGAPNHDALGVARPFDGDGINGAQWDMGAYEFAATLYKVTYDGNGSDGGTAPTDNGNYLTGALVTVLANSFARSGYTFENWNTVANGVGGQSYPGDGTGSFTMGAADVTLHAQWLPHVLDVDGDGVYDALTDGLMVLRHLCGLTGTSVTAGAMATGASRPANQIDSYLAGIHAKLDVDGNGQVDAMTDGLLIIRYMMGLRGAGLTQGIPPAARSPAQIESYILGLMP